MKTLTLTADEWRKMHGLAGSNESWKTWPEAQAIVEEYKAGMKLRDLCAKYHHHCSTVSRLLKAALGVETLEKRRLWTLQEIEYLKNNYTGTNLRELAAHFGRSESNICRKAREFGLTVFGRPSPNRSEANRRSMEAFKQTEGYEAWRQERADFLRQFNPSRFKGKHRTTEEKEDISRRFKALWATEGQGMRTKEYAEKRSIAMSKGAIKRLKEHPHSVYSHAKRGTREDLGFFVRSSWEANYARYLKFLKANGGIQDFQYEPDTFWFENIKRGTRSYTPDFKVWLTPDTYEYHEVKGFMDQKSQTRLDRMARYYPKEKIVVIDEDTYNSIKREFSRAIPYWE